MYKYVTYLVFSSPFPFPPLLAIAMAFGRKGQEGNTILHHTSIRDSRFEVFYPSVCLGSDREREREREREAYLYIPISTSMLTSTSMSMLFGFVWSGLVFWIQLLFIDVSVSLFLGMGWATMAWSGLRSYSMRLDTRRFPIPH